MRMFARLHGNHALFFTGGVGGAWYGGLMGPLQEGEYLVGFDDGDLRKVGTARDRSRNARDGARW